MPLPVNVSVTTVRVPVASCASSMFSPAGTVAIRFVADAASALVEQQALRPAEPHPSLPGPSSVPSRAVVAVAASERLRPASVSTAARTHSTQRGPVQLSVLRRIHDQATPQSVTTRKIVHILPAL